MRSKEFKLTEQDLLKRDVLAEARLLEFSLKGLWKKIRPSKRDLYLKNMEKHIKEQARDDVHMFEVRIGKEDWNSLAKFLKREYRFGLDFEDKFKKHINGRSYSKKHAIDALQKLYKDFFAANHDSEGSIDSPEARQWLHDIQSDLQKIYSVAKGPVNAKMKMAQAFLLLLTKTMQVIPHGVEDFATPKEIAYELQDMPMSYDKYKAFAEMFLGTKDAVGMFPRLGLGEPATKV